MPETLRVGVIGVGHLGARHAEIYAAMPEVRLTAVCDTDAARAKEVAGRLGCDALTDHRELASRVDAASVAVPTTLHGPIGLELLDAGVHLLMEKPIATSLAQADALIREARKRKLTLQVGHIERFNTAIQAAQQLLEHPRFLEIHRLSPYPFRGTDVSVVLDVMIHDLDLLLTLVPSPVTRVDAVGVSVLSPSEDIANARVQFASGCVANLTASRISDEPMRRFRVFQENRYLSIDTREQTVEMARKNGHAIQRVDLPVNKQPPLQDELASFIRAVRLRREPMVSGQDGRAALALALEIERKMRMKRRK